MNLELLFSPHFLLSVIRYISCALNHYESLWAKFFFFPVSFFLPAVERKTYMVKVFSYGHKRKPNKGWTHRRVSE